MSSLFLVNLLTFMSGMLPCIGLLISKMEIKRKIWIIPFEAGFLVLAAFLMSGFGWAGAGVINPVFYAVSLGYYPLMMAVLLPLLCWKFGFSRGLALTFMLGFLLTELHEIVGFGKMYLGLWDNMLALKEYWIWFTPFNHLYSVVVAALALKTANFQRSWAPWGIGLFFVGVLLEILIYSHLSFGAYDFWDVARKLVWLPILLGIFMFGGKKDD